MAGNFLNGGFEVDGLYLGVGGGLFGLAEKLIFQILNLDLKFDFFSFGLEEIFESLSIFGFELIEFIDEFLI